jgi:hypothetical protein
MKRFPTGDPICNLFWKFGTGGIQHLFKPMTEWQMQRLPRRCEGYTWMRILPCSSGTARRKEP